MKRFLKRLVPLFLLLGIIASIGWYLLVYDRGFTRDMLLSHARIFDARGNADLAAKLYDLAYNYTGQDEDVAIELANQYKADGNYTKAELTLTNAIADGGNAELYVALCKTYVEQDKLMDAAALLDNITDPDLKLQLDSLRPAAPETDPAPGFYNEYISVGFKDAEGKLLYTLDGDYPSIQDAPFTESITLPAGETLVTAIVVADNGLVSPLTVANFTITGVIEEAVFTDPAMELSLREMLNIDPEDPVMTDLLWEVKEFTIPEEAEVLSDLIYLPYLEKLTVPDRKLDSLSILSTLEYLKELDLSGCRFPTGDMEILAALPNLEKLSMASCGLSTIADLSGAVNLTHLDLSGNTLRNLQPLTNMSNLQELQLQHNAVTSLSDLSVLTSLTKLDISYNSVTDLSPLFVCEKLSWLGVSNNQISKLDGMEVFTAMTHLDLSHNQLTEVAALKSLTALTELNISYNKLEYIHQLSELTNLANLNCSNNEIYHLPIWSAESALSTLDASHNNIESLDPLAKLENLTYVYLDYNMLTTLDPIANCYRLVMVSAYGNNIQNISELTKHNIIVNYDPT